MPLRMVHRQPAGKRFAATLKFFTQRQRLCLHPLLYFFARLIQRIKLVRQHARFADVVAQQQRYANRHIIKPPCCVKSWTQRKT
ncbi:hypothetical protein D3C78_1332050 [compost metagenome]